MFGTYLRRELLGRRRQTIIIAVGMALAIGLVILVNSISAGVQNAQASVLASVYGVGTDVTISQAATPPTAGAAGGGQQGFAFGSGSGDTSGGTTNLSQSRLVSTPTQTVFDAGQLATVKGVSGVAASTGTLSLENIIFSGQVPDRQAGATGGNRTPGGTTDAAPPTGGADGAGGSAFNLNRFSVLGVDSAGDSVGPLSSVAVATGRVLAPTDAGTDVAVLDSSYATSASLAVGGTITIGGTAFQIVGTVSSTGTDSTTAANVYVPLDVAQSLSSNTGKLSTIYVQAASSSGVDQLAADLKAALPTATVNTQADLASTVSGSLSTASSLVSSLGTWLSVLVLAAAFLIAILFTISGVTRRTREFGTLKAIGWSNGRIVRQVAGESMVQGLTGGVIGVIVGIAGIAIVNAISPTLTGSASTGGGLGGAARRAAGAAGSAATGGGATGEGGGGFGQRAAGGGFGAAANQATSTVALHAPFTIEIVLIAVGLAIVGGLLAGAIGGWRAARLRPAEALRSVA
ncbi:ABC transporter permease [Subtercola frigoramans]|uniref:ABC-type antimicrobial peptide transport system permease subunit n=1 Tax=Subtercola frigoramans TaxID=120298 RepID=A0ABS2L1T6_9MICO|nr:FtsX-like permease family protein [Subtercola frigoramans]MBM7471041.1 ABC-type antimicrobial peptide transport system permease subunit [Subtercola frigoramans]